jgi:hypothetical protein
LGIQAAAQRSTPERRNRFHRGAALVLAAWALGLSVFWNDYFSITEIKNGEKTFAKACAAAQKVFPPGTLVVTFTFSGSFYYYTDFPILRWDQVGPTEFARYAALAQKAGRTVAAVNYKWEEQDALQKHCPGNWQRVALVGDAILWRLAPGVIGASHP